MESYADIGVLLMMIGCGLLPFALLCRLMIDGKTGLAITLISVLAAVLAFAMFASVRPFGVDPMAAIVAVGFVLTPAMAGATAGLLLGWLVVRRRNKAFARKTHRPSRD